ncbi:E3 ubiquitin-protein ligase RNF26 isoform X1 [Labrus bergylta]|uniref:E3 ubiquitin-protein ligase RNF26 n=2 Tax=Labrus bergylta TaxID=56723 RepID=A0A3Q3LE19_9LABR|nr:E3 ubiquitin-protein ligase RNF26-like isoform X1 [Labrus bergylta]
MRPNMDEVNVVSLAVGRCVDACCLLLDLLVRAFTWLLRFLSGVGASLHSTMVALSSSSLVEYWNFALFSFLTATEAVSCAACGALQVVEGWLQMLGGVLESFKMVGHLFCHMGWRIKDVLHRGFISGGCILRQTCEGLCIALSLVLYFVNTVINIVLISTQNCASVLVGVWEVVADPLHRVVDLALTLLTFLYSCLVGASVLLWTPCQLLLDFLAALGRVFLSVLTLDLHVLLITAVIVLIALLFMNPTLPVHAARLSVRFMNALQGAGHIQTIVEQALANQAVYIRTAQDVSRTRPPHTHTGILNTETNVPEAEPSPPDSLPLHTRDDSKPASSSKTKDQKKSPDVIGPLTDMELLSLLKEQEERKKCVICQDQSKTVLLLPCRHLCLCRHCADILTQRRAVQQRCCPLCRQPITKTMDVFL